MSDIVMPRLSDTMEEGTILRWLKRDGDNVRRGEQLVEIETDKAAMTYESDSEGTLEIVAREGDTLAVGAPIARIGHPGGGGNGEGDVVGQAAAQIVKQASEQPTAPPNMPALTPNGSHSEQRIPDRGERVKASPLARRIAHDTGVDLRALTGSGPGGRIIKADVEASLAPEQSTPTVPAEGTPTATAPPTGAQAQEIPTENTPGTATPPPAGAQLQEIASARGEATTVELSRTQRTIARRMAESKATIPDFTLTADIDMERCVELRAELKRLSHADAPTYNDMIVKACALALRDHPRANGSYRDGRFELHGRVNVGMAVAAGADDPTGSALVVPTVFDADTKALGEIARETRTLAERVRDGSITPPELSGGTFTVSNLGMYGIVSFTAIVNPPQAAILAVGAVAPRPVVRKKKIAARQRMSVTLACDHRILYGADAALFLARIRELLEEPAALTL
jgi:pyruvate dehydrogenase E2 component (dihydrolipoamide acetyltransferase)